MIGDDRGDAEQHDGEEGPVGLEEPRHQPVEDERRAEPAASAITTDATFHGTPSHVSDADEHGYTGQERPRVLGDVPVVGERQLGRVAAEPDDLVPAGVPDVRVLEVPGMRPGPRIRAPARSRARARTSS